MSDTSFPRTGGRTPQPIGSKDEKQAWTTVNVGPSTRNEMHELGNLIVGLQFSLRQLGGRQRTEELEGVVRTGLESCEQGIAAFRKLHEALNPRNKTRPIDESDDIREEARRYQMRAGIPRGH